MPPRQSALISVEALARLLADGEAGATLLDVRWQLAGGADAAAYARGHVPGAAFVDLDRGLSAPRGRGGRHPLPEPGDFEAHMRALGVGASRPVVLYDESTSMAAARGWWLLRYFGHPQVAVLDGGFAAWVRAGQPTRTGVEASEPGDFVARPGAMPRLDAARAAQLAAAGVLLDARARERYSGAVEPIDPVGGHIPGALNLPTSEHVDEDGLFRSPAALRAAFAAVGVRDGVATGAYCGSGVTAAHEILALEVAGFHGAALYAGSWSDWITDSARPVALGSEPGRPVAPGSESGGT